MRSVGDGVHVFLIWDMHAAAISTFIWALALVQAAKIATKGADQLSWTRLGLETRAGDFGMGSLRRTLGCCHHFDMV